MPLRAGKSQRQAQGLLGRELSSENHYVFKHDQGEVLGILLTNLGTPDSCSPRDVRRYLKTFLWDPRVVEMQRPLWWLILNLVVLNTRPRRSAAAYSKIWGVDGSPLLTNSRQQQQALQLLLDQHLEQPTKVALAMRYGNPSISAGLNELNRAGARRVLVLPLYPQYSATTTASTFDAVSRELRSWRWLPELRFVNHYHDHPAYISALAESVRSFWDEYGEPEKLVLSFHGIPEDYFHAGDPYFCECQKTGRLLAAALGLAEQRWALTFQSRLGPKKWLQPYTDKTLEVLAGAGIKRVHVICPGFSTDCLETLEEIAMENRDTFFAAGGTEYHYIPCLNAQRPHIEMMLEIVKRHTRDWMPAGEETSEEARSERRQRALQFGAEG